MRITILAVGRLGRSSEAVLALDYGRRATAAGRALGIGPVDIQEVDAKKPGREAEAEVLTDALPDATFLIACDERGSARTSREFASRLAGLRDRGERRLVLIIGGPDGLSPRLVEGAQERLALGPQTWPHALARVMIAEQVYRAVTILAGTPYHRD